MNASRAWLQDYVNTATPAAALGERFRMTSSELDGLTDWSERLTGVVTGKVVEVRPHPNAERLKVTKVDTGKDTRKIVCGAPNVAEGQTVLVALPGTTLHPVGKEPLTIAQATIRGEESEGMLCALEELGIPVASDGIFTFSEPVKPGTAASKALFEDDVILDLEVTPNRPDLLSHYGLAREVSTFERKPLQPLMLANWETRGAKEQLTLTLHGHRECLRLSAVVVDGIKVVPSPWWLQSRLLRCGIRPINNVVDVTNYVMLELGQPLHAYDAALLAEAGALTLGVRAADPGEKAELLDGTTRTLSGGDIVITDAADQVIGLAGIMGGARTAVQETTDRIVLEAATFPGAAIRRTSRRLGLRSEASLRFEKGLDPELTITALKRAIYLLQEMSPAKPVSKIADSHIHPVQRPVFHLSFSTIHQVLGVRISAADCKDILQRLGFTLRNLTKSGFDATPPSWRKDVQGTHDVIEELIRIWGYDRLPYTLPVGAVKAPRHNAAVQAKQTIRHALAALGYRETIHVPLYSAALLERVGLVPNQAVPLANPLSSELAYLAPTHVLGLLDDSATGAREYEELLSFELGKTFHPPHHETERLTLLARTDGNAEHAVRQLKTALERLCQLLEVGDPTYVPSAGTSYGEDGHTLEVQVDGHNIGTLSLVSGRVVAAYKIRRGKEIVIMELNVERLLELPRVVRFYTPAPQYPVSIRDLTVQVPLGLPLATLMEAAAAAIDPGVVSRWFVTTIFTGKPLPENRKAVTLRLTYNAADRTLSDEEIQHHHRALEHTLTNL